MDFETLTLKERTTYLSVFIKISDVYKITTQFSCHSYLTVFLLLSVIKYVTV